MVIVGGTYQIIQGVRRAKAFQLTGATTIRAVIQAPDGTHGPEIEVLIENLRSPYKSEIDMSTHKQADRFWSIWNAIQSGKESQLPPVIIEHGSRGKPVQDIGWSY